MSEALPFSAVVGQDDARLALLLGAVDPGVGGVLLSGEKGTAKTTLVRGLAALLPGITVVAKCRFSCDPAAPDPVCPDGPHPPGAAAQYRAARLVELPLGATEDRVTGSLDVPRVLAGAPTAEAFVPGLLAQAHRGILYVDEVNLLPDHLVDVLLDAAATGTATVEREGVSLRHACRFLLVGTMNPEEGELRPQLQDRFGLCVPVVASADPRQRADAVRARLSHDLRPAVAAAAHEQAGRQLTGRIAAARARLGGVDLPDAELMRITSACAALGVDGLRGDLVTARTAIAHAAWRGESVVTGADIREAARLALPHRRRRGQFDDPGLDQAQLDDAFGPPDETDGAGPGGTTPPDPPDGAGPGGTTPPDPPDDDGGGPGGTTSPDPPDDDGGGQPADGPDHDAAPPQRHDGSEPADLPSPPGPRTAAAPGGAFAIRHLQAAGLGSGSGGRRSRSRGAGGRPAATAATASRPDLVPTLRAAVLARPGEPLAVTGRDL